MESQYEIVLIADPRILTIPIEECNEPLLDLSLQDEILFGPSPEIPNNVDYTKLRKTVYEKLYMAQKLLPHGVRFCLYEGYRSLELQALLFNQHQSDLKKANPTMTPETLFKETTKMVSPVVNLDGTKNIPPHSTGGAFDIYLINEDNQPLDMGIHPANWMNDIQGILSLTDSQVISTIARQNRQIMTKALLTVGFINYPTEYWHWSYGDRYWAFHTEAPYAFYNIV